MIKSVYFQGCDEKARRWTEFFSVPVNNFVSLKDMWYVLLNCSSNDLVVFRYQNNPSRLIPTFAILSTLCLLLVKAYFFNISIVWICHNVDQDTSPHFKWLEGLRRFLLGRCADIVFVLDPLFVNYCSRSDAIPITFGPKTDGTTRPKTILAAEDLAQSVDRIILIAGQDGGKYKAFQRIPELYDCFSTMGLRAGFITAGMAPDRSFSKPLEAVILRVDEPNLCERDLSDLVNYVYRENADISIPYTIYAAATAGIPVITSDDSLLAEIVLREGIGLTIGMLSSEYEIKYDFDGFLGRHRWSSLKEALNREGILV